MSCMTLALWASGTPIRNVDPLSKTSSPMTIILRRGFFRTNDVNAYSVLSFESILNYNVRGGIYPRASFWVIVPRHLVVTRRQISTKGASR